MRLLVLDVDGVLNSTRSAIGLGGYGYFPREAMRDSYKRNDLAFLREQANLDPVAVGILRRILIETECLVLVSSTWRLGVTVDDLNHLFLAHELPPVVIDKTCQTDEGFRGTEVKIWLDGRDDVTDYLILDDDSDFFDFQKDGHFIHTDGAVGLDYNAYATITKRWSDPKKPPKPEPVKEVP
jgi:hypothetical protein